MKNKISKIALVGVMGFARLGFAACGSSDPEPYIKVSGLDTAYVQGETLNLEGAKILYYSDKNDTTADEITLTESMVANFSTNTTGNQTMKISWNNCELNVNYSVISTNDFITLYTNAYNNTIAETNVHINANIYNSLGQYLGNAITNISNNISYSSVVNYFSFYEEWIQKEGDNWFEYWRTNEEIAEKIDMTENANNKTIVEIACNYLLAIDNFTNLINNATKISYDVEGTKTILNFTTSSAKGKYIIENGKIVGMSSYLSEASSNASSCFYEIEISYDENDIVMIDVPSSWSTND